MTSVPPTDMLPEALVGPGVPEGQRDSRESAPAPREVSLQAPDGEVALCQRPARPRASTGTRAHCRPRRPSRWHERPRAAQAEGEQELRPPGQDPLSWPCGWSPQAAGGGGGKEGGRLADNRPSCAAPLPPLLGPTRGRLAGCCLTPAWGQIRRPPSPWAPEGKVQALGRPLIGRAWGARRSRGGQTSSAPPSQMFQGGSPAPQLLPRGSRKPWSLLWKLPHRWRDREVGPLPGVEGQLVPSGIQPRPGLFALELRTFSGAQAWPAPGWGGGHKRLCPAHLLAHPGSGEREPDEGEGQTSEQPAQAAHRACQPPLSGHVACPPPAWPSLPLHTHTAEKQAPARGEPAGTQSN